MGEAAVLNVNVELVGMGPCHKCGIVYAVPRWFKQTRLDDRSVNFHCPNGHSAVFAGPTEADRLRKQLEEQRRETEWAKQGRDRAQRQASAARGQVTRIKNRIKNGVCPCCKRSFENLARHMATKHPNYTTDPTDE